MITPTDITNSVAFAAIAAVLVWPRLKCYQEAHRPADTKATTKTRAALHA